MKSNLLYLLLALPLWSMAQESSVLINSYIRPENGKEVTYHLFWDTKTGNSQLLSWNSAAAAYRAAEIGLPNNPIGTAQGEVMVNSYVNSGKTFHLFWDTKTGNSKLYTWEAGGYKATQIGLPDNPIGKVEGRVLVRSYVRPENGKEVTYHLFWDTKTGNSQLYSWNAPAGAYRAAEIGLPNNPIGTAQGEVMVNSYVNSGKTFHLFWDTKTGNSKLYTWEIGRYKATEIGLPDNPLGKVEGEVLIRTYIRPENGKEVTYHLFWDNKTGNSQLYSWNAPAGAYRAAEIGLPNNPLGTVKGEVRVNSYVNSGKTFHLFWDSQTGDSQIYTWEAGGYKATQIGLPKNVLNK